VIADTVFAPVQSTDRVRGDAGAARHRDQARPAAAGHAAAAERELCEQLGIARSTLRQALTALVQSGHLHAVRGRGGGTFVAERRRSRRRARGARRLARPLRRAPGVELGVAVLAAERAEPERSRR
jgi:DNA-binding GntR family transcriptional regulator